MSSKNCTTIVTLPAIEHLTQRYREGGGEIVNGKYVLTDHVCPRPGLLFIVVCMQFQKRPTAVRASIG